MRLIFEKTDYNYDPLALNLFKVEEEQFLPFWHYHTEIEIVLVQSGFGTRYIGDCIETFNSPELVIIGSGIPHQWISDESSPHCSAIVIHFKRELFEQIPACKSLLPFLDQSKAGMWYKPSSHIIQLFENAIDNDSSLQLSFLIGMLSFLKATEAKPIITNGINVKSSSSIQMNRTKAVIEFIISNLDRHMSLDEVAQLNKQSRPSFCRWFKKATGHTFVNFLNISRIEKAGHLLVNTENRISDICYASGFESISQFNRTFKKVKGVSPRSYRNQIQ